MEKLEKILHEYARFIAIDSNIQSNMALASLGIDSLDMLGLIVKIEDEFDLEIPPERVTPDTFSTLGSIWQLLCQIDPKLAESGASND